MEDLLDFELDDPLFRTPSPIKPKRRKLIGLDDLLTDHYKEGSKVKEVDGKNAKNKKGYTSDDDDQAQKIRERQLSKFVESCHKQVHEMATEDDVPPWGVEVFGHQKSPPEVEFFDLKSCKLLQNPDISKIDMDIQGESFMEGLLENGWLLNLVFVTGYVEDCIASWAFNKMMYSSKEGLHSSACEFWCSILSSNKILTTASRSKFLCYSAIKFALANFGYVYGLFDSSSTTKLRETDSRGNGPPSNIKSWLKFVTVICKFRGSQMLLSTAEVEELSFIILSLFLERRLQGFSFLLDECLMSVTSFFAEEEWHCSCQTIAIAVANRIPKDLNCLQVVQSISMANARGKGLRSALAFQILIQLFDEKVVGAEDILEALSSVKLKEKHCDFLRLYIHIVLVENWLYYDTQLVEKPVVLEMWYRFLRICSSQITSTDWRPYASKVRNRASYLMQSETQ